MQVDPTAVYSQKALSDTARLVGNTPLIAFSGLETKTGAEVFAKAEWMQLGSSVKARAAFGIISEGLKQGKWKPGQRLIDATSGNTGIAYAAICARLGLPLTICMPENASPERKWMLRSLGAELVFTSPLEGTEGSQVHARAMIAINPDLYFYADQYNNPANWQAHYTGTGPEIWRQTEGKITHFVAGMGTTGTLTGTGRYFRDNHPHVQIVGLQPDTSLHGLEGWKHLETAISIPGIYDSRVAHETVEVTTDEAHDMIRQAARTQGILLSPSAAANLVGAGKVAARLESGVVVTMLADDASKYADVMNEIFKP